MRAVMLVAGLMMATPAMGADQFDLVCKGRQKLGVFGRWKPYEVRYRIDLISKTYCRFDCKGLETIYSADAARIEFAPPNQPGSPTQFHYIDRSDGKLVDFQEGLVSAEGVYEPGLFTGLPAAKF